MDMLVVIRADDPETVAAFYAALGFRGSPEKHGRGPEHYAFRVGQSVLEIYPRQGTSESTRATRLGFGVPDIAAACRAVKTAGGAVIKEEAESPWGRRAVVADPEGHTVELTELPAPAGQ